MITIDIRNNENLTIYQTKKRIQEIIWYLDSAYGISIYLEGDNYDIRKILGYYRDNIYTKLIDIKCVINLDKPFSDYELSLRLLNEIMKRYFPDSKIIYNDADDLNGITINDGTPYYEWKIYGIQLQDSSDQLVIEAKLDFEYADNFFSKLEILKINEIFKENLYPIFFKYYFQDIEYQYTAWKLQNPQDLKPEIINNMQEIMDKMDAIGSLYDA